MPSGTASCGPRLTLEPQLVSACKTKEGVNSPILMQQQNVKPVLLVSRHVHSHSITPQLKMHPGIFDIADAVQAKP